MTKLIDITPEAYRCAAGACPAVFQVLTENACGAGSCPAIARSGDDYIIIGKITGILEHPELEGRIGPEEQAVKISAALLEEALKRKEDAAA